MESNSHFKNLRDKYPANVEGSNEFNEANKKLYTIDDFKSDLKDLITSLKQKLGHLTREDMTDIVESHEEVIALMNVYMDKSDVISDAQDLEDALQEVMIEEL